MSQSQNEVLTKIDQYLTDRHWTLYRLQNFKPPGQKASDLYRQKSFPEKREPVTYPVPPLFFITHLENIKLQADALNPTYIKAFPDTVILYYTTTTPLFRSTPSLLLRYVLPHDNKDPSSSGGNYVPEFSVMFWGAFLFQSLLWQRCAEVHVE